MRPAAPSTRSATRARAVAGSRPSVGSSSTSTAGSTSSARAAASRRRSPPEIAPAVQPGVEAVGQAGEPVAEPDPVQDGDEVGVGGGRGGEPQVLAQGGREDVVVLADDGDHAAPAVAGHGGGVHPAERHAPGRRVEQAREHRGERRLARPRGARDAEAVPGGEVEVEVAQGRHGSPAGGDVVEDQASPSRGVRRVLGLARRWGRRAQGGEPGAGPPSADHGGGRSGEREDGLAEGERGEHRDRGELR